MNTFSSPDARFWKDRLRPVETLVWVGRPRFTVTIGAPLLWAIVPATLYASFYLWTAFSRPDAPMLGQVLASWQTHGIALAMMAGLACCALYLVRFGLLFPFQARYAITDRRLMIWRQGVSPALVDEEIDLSLKLFRPGRPPNSVLFSSDLLMARGTHPAGFDAGKRGRRQVGFLNPGDPEGMDRALHRVLKDVPGVWQ